MGWAFGWDTREQLVNHLLNDSNHDLIASKSTCYGRRLWAVFRPTWEGRNSDEPFICLFLLEDGGRRDGWGYKDVTESMGPCEYDCPLDLLDLAPPPKGGLAEEWAARWRQKVREYHAARCRKYTVGDRVTIYGKTYQVTGKVRRSYLVRRMHGDGSTSGPQYRTTAAKMQPAPEVLQ